MSDKHHRKIDTSHLQNPDVKHEKSDVRIRPLIMFAVYLTIAAAIIHVMMYFLFQYFEERAVTSEGPPSPLAAERQVLPPEPRLQLAPTDVGQGQPDLKTHPLEEMKALRSEEAAALSQYSWVDEQSGIVRLPIKRAKELLFERGGLPSRPEPGNDERLPPDSSGGTKPEIRSR